MSKLEFGIFDNFGPSTDLHPITADVYEEHLHDAQMAEELGYRYYFFIEHQNSPAGQITAPTVYLAALSQRTSTIRFGVMIFPLPFYHPVRLAQDITTLDHLSRGRVEFPVGLGVYEHEFLRWKLPFSERRAMSEEAMEIIIKAWTEETVTYQGKYWQLDEALPYPRPYQQPHPPIWFGAHSPTSLEYAARNNFNVAQMINADPMVAEKFQYFRRTWKDLRHPGPAPRTFLVRHVHVAETDEQARAEAEPNLVAGMTQEYDLIANTRVGWGQSARGIGLEDSPDIRARGHIFEESGKSYDFWIDNGLALVGSPDTVARKLEEQHKLIGYDLFCARHRFGRLSPQQVKSSTKLFAERVMTPALV